MAIKNETGVVVFDTETTGLSSRSNEDDDEED